MDSELGTQLKQIYSRRFDEQREYRRKVWEVLVGEFFQRFLTETDAVLDLGCGYGQFINQVRARTRYGIDLNPHSREMLAPEVNFFEQDCSTAWPLPDGSLDVIFTSNFFEHLPTKPILERTIHEASRCLKKSGKLIALGPNIKYVGGAYWDFWDHHIGLTELSLSELLETNGFYIEKAIPRFLPYTMVNQREMPTFMIRLYLRLPFVWRLLGHQFLLIGRKV